MRNALVNLLRKKRRKVVVEPYSKLAPYYNEIMSHVDYANWAEYVLHLAYEHIQDVQEIFDFACGTGNLAFYLSCFGYKVSGADGNFDMVEQAKASALEMEKDIKFQVCDMRQKPNVSPQSLVLCLYDSLNYLHNEEDLGSFFNSVRRIIKDNGLFIFDCSTEMNSLTHFSKYEFTEKIFDTTICRQANYDKINKIQHNQFEIFPLNDDCVYYEHHQQKIWSIKDITRILELNNLSMVGIYDGYSFEPGSEESDRVHFAAKPV